MPDPQEALLPDGSRVTLIHFVYRLPRGPFGGTAVADAAGGQRWSVACVPNLLELHAANMRPTPWQRTDDPRAVTCPECKKSEAYRLALAQVPGGLGR